MHRGKIEQGMHYDEWRTAIFGRAPSVYAAVFQPPRVIDSGGYRGRPLKPRNLTIISLALQLG